MLNLLKTSGNLKRESEWGSQGMSFHGYHQNWLAWIYAVISLRAKLAPSKHLNNLNREALTYKETIPTVEITG